MALTSILFFKPHHLHAKELKEDHSRVLWGQRVDYQRIVHLSTDVDFDGKAFLREEKGKIIPTVVLNPAFFRKEARGIFQRFDKRSSLSSDLASIDPGELQGLEASLLVFTKGKMPRINPREMESLTQLQRVLEKRAWFPLYQKAKQEAHSHRDALEKFVEGFTQIRLETIEQHEASHLLDLLQNVEISTEDFDRNSELNAFFTELRYGENPDDVMAQALAGLADELRRGQSVDYSALKVSAVLKFLQAGPLKGVSSITTPAATPCLEKFLQIPSQDWILAGKNLYRPFIVTRHLSSPIKSQAS